MTPRARRRERWWDIGGILFALAVAWLVVADLPTSLSDSKTLLVICLSLASSTMLWWRRRWPVAIALMLAVPTLLTDAVGGAALVAIYTVASRDSWRVTVALVSVHLVASAFWLRIFEDGRSFYAEMVLSLALLSIPTTWGMVVKARREVIDSLRDRAERAETAALERADRVRGQERERIAREMHDALAHRISMVSLHAGALEVRVDADRAEIEAIAGTIRASAHGALDDLREILGVLRSDEDSPPVRPGSSIAAIPALLDEVRTVGVVVDYENEIPSSVVVPATPGRNVFRVVQEGLTNARKHASGSPVRVHIWVEGDDIRVSLTNLLGSRASDVPGSRSGLIGLTERLTLSGGKLEHGVKIEAGSAFYVLGAWLPWSA
ncbi:sensor histidine kinase [Rhodococcoides yunnanense]|uniref:sensor histidine kinase n=1 Tax=Rhodococcoides yunnanense TaxID=278209 RepID=UPI0009FC12C6|nr:histidine kinase [Rhodococcus yunnanensis]